MKVYRSDGSEKQTIPIITRIRTVPGSVAARGAKAQTRRARCGNLKTLLVNPESVSLCDWIVNANTSKSYLVVLHRVRHANNKTRSTSTKNNTQKTLTHY